MHLLLPDMVYDFYNIIFSGQIHYELYSNLHIGILAVSKWCDISHFYTQHHHYDTGSCGFVHLFAMPYVIG